MNLKTQSNFARIVGKPVSRINLLIALNRLETKIIDGVVFVINNEKNKQACSVRHNKRNHVHN